MIDTILFDLDGTLIPYSTEHFVAAYFEGLLGLLLPLGYEKNSLLAAIRRGNAAIYENDGRVTNREAFFCTMEEALGARVWEMEPIIDRYYATDFHRLRTLLETPRDCRPLLDGLHARGLNAALFTNPFFPKAAAHARLSWVNLKPEDFLYITAYDMSHFVKPNPAYFAESLARIGKTPEQCLMVGNDATEDMAAAALGIDTFLVTDNLENPGGVDITQFRKGTYEEMVTFLCKEK